ncbi:MAG: nucleotidyltransferase domain-containing protein [Candidatus Nanoarchaeia archaeon]
MNRFGLTEETIQKICNVFMKHPEIEKAVIYGSRAKGNFKNGSDIDLTLFGTEELKLNVLLKVMSEIDDLLLPYSFDISIFREIKDNDLIEHINRVGIVFFKKT